MQTSTCRALAVAALISIAAMSPAIADEVRITRLTGAVSISVAGVKVSAHAGSTVSTPLKIETGQDGSLHIEQASSALDIGPDSVVLLPGSPAAAGMTERILQHAGRVLFSVKPRKTRSFAVETPYLVSVVKGTTFSVAIENNATTVALLEGSVEVSGQGMDERVLLLPNQSARRAAGERSISVTKFDAARPPPTTGSSSDGALPQSADRDDVLALASSDTLQDLNEITASQSDRRRASTSAGAGPTVLNPAPQPAPTPNVPADPTPEAAPNPAPTPQPQPEPDTTPGPTPDPLPNPAPEPTPGDDDDGNNGGGNDDDHDDDSNPGHGRRNRR